MTRSITNGLLMASLFGLIFLNACDSKPKNPVAEYGDALMDAHSRSKNAADTATLDALRSSIQTYYASKGEYPKNIEEVGKLLSSPADLSKYNYDPQSGSISLKP